MSRSVRRQVRFEPRVQSQQGRPIYGRPGDGAAAYHDPHQQQANLPPGEGQGRARYDADGFILPGEQAPAGYGGYGPAPGYGSAPGNGPAPGGRPQPGNGRAPGGRPQPGDGTPAGYRAGPGDGTPAGYRAGPGGGAPGRNDATRFDLPPRSGDATRYDVPVNGNGRWREARATLNGDRHNPAAPHRPAGPPPMGGRKAPRFRKRRIRRLWRLRTVKVATALLALFAVWLSFSVGQALTNPNGGTISSKLAEWARDHYLGPVVTFGEWLTYKAPPVGGKPSFSLTQGEVKTKFRRVRGFTPIIPANLTSPAGRPLAGEGVWSVAETVKGQPAMFTTFLRADAVHTSIVAGIVSMDQRLLSFWLHPGSEDPGPGNWGTRPYIPVGSRKGLMATFNGGFKLNVSGGGFYLNGQTKGALTNGAASLVYYKDGAVKIGVWGRDVGMTPDVAGVRQNLKPIVDHGQIPADVNQNALSSWGATLGGAYYVWRSGLGITKDGRVIYVYGPALSVSTLAGLLHRAGAVEAMEMDINPFWTSFESYHGNSSDPTPKMLLPDQQTTAYRYYSSYSRDFTAVYAR